MDGGESYGGWCTADASSPRKENRARGSTGNRPQPGRLLKLYHRHPGPARVPAWEPGTQRTPKRFLPSRPFSVRISFSSSQPRLGRAPGADTGRVWAAGGARPPPPPPPLGRRGAGLRGAGLLGSAASGKAVGSSALRPEQAGGGVVRRRRLPGTGGGERWGAAGGGRGSSPYSGRAEGFASRFAGIQLSGAPGMHAFFLGCGVFFPFFFHLGMETFHLPWSCHPAKGAPYSLNYGLIINRNYCTFLAI